MVHYEMLSGESSEKLSPERVTQPVLLLSDAKSCELRALTSHPAWASLGAPGLLRPESLIHL